MRLSLLVAVLAFALADDDEKPEMCKKYATHVICKIHDELDGLVGDMKENIKYQTDLQDHMKNKSSRVIARMDKKFEKKTGDFKKMIAEDVEFSCGEKGPLFKQMKKAQKMIDNLKNFPRCPRGCTCEEKCMTCGKHKACDDKPPMFLDEGMLFCANKEMPLMGCGSPKECGSGCPAGFSCFTLKFGNGTDSKTLGCCPTKVSAIPTSLKNSEGNFTRRCNGEAAAKKDNKDITTCSKGTVSCPENYQCTLASDADGICCPTSKVNGDGKAAITPLLIGTLSSASASASSYLVKADGFEAIVDLGWPSEMPKLVKGMKDANVKLCDLDYAVATHEHMDHVGATALFARMPFIDGCGKVNYRNYTWDTDLNDADKKRLILHPNVEIRKTPGHTKNSCDDQSIFVYNMKDMGTAVICGDLFLNADDVVGKASEEGNAKISRTTIICTADYVFPGHGKFFQVTEEMKNAYGC